MRDDMLYLTMSHSSILHLQSIGQSLVHLGNLGGDAEVDGAVTDLDEEAANQVGVDLNRQLRRGRMRVRMVLSINSPW